MKKFLVQALAMLPSLSHAQSSYWQQKVDTKIEVRLDDKTDMLHGFEEFTYYNNSPDTLRFLYIHLWPNAYKNDFTPFARQQDLNKNTDFYYAPQKDKGFIDSLQFSVNGYSADHHSTPAAPDIARLELDKPLYPGKSIKVTTPFRVKLPAVFSRSGHTGQAYYVAQWFPKPAVYDKKGWHPISYLDQGEFYSEYGSYEVAITTPANYVILATGNCITSSENDWMDSLAKKPLPADTLYSKTFPPSSDVFKTVTYKEDNIHDFAWFADKRYIVRKDTVHSPVTGDLINTWTAFLPSYQDKWKNGNLYLKQAVQYYGKWVGPYPYKTIKAALGDMKAGGGMEYPTLTLIDKVASGKLNTVVIHEAGHNWFYGMLGSNERDYPWMDEGINSYYEQKTTAATDSSKHKGSNFNEALLYFQNASTNRDQPINCHSTAFENTNYGLDVYYKTALVLGWLETYMGHDTFELAMHDYFTTWKWKHPQPEDFRTIFEKHTDRSLNWFFDTIMNTSRRIDYSIVHAHKQDGSTTFSIKNRTHVFAPAQVSIMQGDSVIGSVWSVPFDRKTTLTIPTTTWTSLRISDTIPDAHTTNNEFRKSALFHHFGLAIKPVLGLNRSYKEKLFIAPAIGLNKHDGFMAGLLLHNLTLPETRFAYALAPMYAFGSSSLTGTGALGYTWYPHSAFQQIMLSVEGKTFHNDQTEQNLTEPLYARYIKVAPSLTFTFRQPSLQSHVVRTLRFKEYNINEEQINYGADSTAIPTLATVNNTYLSVKYQHKNDRAYNPFGYSAEVHGNGDFAKINIDGNIRIDYYAKHKSLYVRGYFGKFFAINNDPSATWRYQLNAAYGGVNDYLYDGTFRARNMSGFSGQQVSALNEGGFKVPVFNVAYRSDNWLATLNLKTDLPKISFPIRLFFDVGMMPNPKQGFASIRNTQVFYDGGVELYFPGNIVSFYFPVIMSPDFSDYLRSTYGSKNIFARSISFTLHLQNINWLHIPSSLMRGSLD